MPVSEERARGLTMALGLIQEELNGSHQYAIGYVLKRLLEDYSSKVFSFEDAIARVEAAYRAMFWDASGHEEMPEGWPEELRE